MHMVAPWRAAFSISGETALRAPIKKMPPDGRRACCEALQPRVSGGPLSPRARLNGGESFSL
jgi:hypothetical protein